MIAPKRKLVISLHDATPFHLERMKKAEVLFAELGVSKITYLLVPEYHGSYPSAADPAFIAWCRAPRPFAVDWHLHGYHHLEALPGSVVSGAADSGAGGRSGSSLADAGKRVFLTAGEGEFLAMDAETQRRTLIAGKEVFHRCLGNDPEGFVPPAWLSNARLVPLLKELGFRFCEDHRRMYRADTGAQLPSPVVTWATRTFLRKYGSLVVCPALARLWSSVPVLRIAMHPFDFDHASTTANIRAVLERALAARDQAFAADLDWP